MSTNPVSPVLEVHEESERRFWPAVGGLLLLLVLSLALHWPIPVAMDQVYLTPTGDFGHGYWNLWWAAEALSTGKDPLNCEMLYYDAGVNLSWGNFPVLLAYAVAPVTWAFGPAAAYNLLFLLSFFLASWGAFLLGRYITGSWWAGMGAGIAYGFLPWNSLMLTNISYCHSEWLPFLILSLLKLKDSGRYRHAIWAAVWLACAFYTSPYFGLYSGLCAAFVGIAYLVVGPPAGRGSWFAGLLLCLALTVLFTAYRTVPMAREALNGVQVEEVVPRTQADLAGLKVRLDPDELDDPLWLISWTSVYGYVLVLGALAAFWLRGFAKTSGWLLLALFFFGLSLGPDLSLGGRKFSAFLPADLLSQLPVLGALRGYEKAQTVVMLCLAVLFALTLESIVRGSTGRSGTDRRRGAFSCALILSLMVAESWPPPRVPRGDVVPSAYHELGAKEVEGAMLFLPFDPRISDRSQMRPMFMQTVHRQPLITGHYSSRFDPEHRRRLAQVPVLAELMAAHGGEPGLEIKVPEKELANAYRRQLQDLGITTVVLQSQLIRRSGTFLDDRQPVGLEKDWAAFLAPLWWGPVAQDLVYPPRRPAKEFYAPPRQVWMHPSVQPFLEAVLGPPAAELEDGALLWRLESLRAEPSEASSSPR